MKNFNVAPNDMRGMKALSIRQPWAWLIAHGHKPFENREWCSGNPGRRFRGPVLIHAAKGMTRDEYEQGKVIARIFEVELPKFEDLQRGGIVGVAEVVRWHDTTPKLPFAFGSGLELANMQPTPFVPCKGLLGFFTPKFEGGALL